MLIATGWLLNNDMLRRNNNVWFWIILWFLIICNQTGFETTTTVLAITFDHQLSFLWMTAFKWIFKQLHQLGYPCFHFLHLLRTRITDCSWIILNVHTLNNHIDRDIAQASVVAARNHLTCFINLYVSAETELDRRIGSIKQDCCININQISWHMD